ncbi:hypothetical protein INR49_015216 [Caranx melampygus]|nr:hypothetical protein INR49_015216 [Caranx melampygus]
MEPVQGVQRDNMDKSLKKMFWFSVTNFVFESFVLVGFGLRFLNVGKSNLSGKLLQRRQAHCQVPHRDGGHQEP